MEKRRERKYMKRIARIQVKRPGAKCRTLTKTIGYTAIVRV